MNLLFPLSFPTLVDRPLLYVRGGATRENGWEIKAGESASFNTYFNCFSYDKYRRLTLVERVVLRLLLTGKGKVILRRQFVTDEFNAAFAKVDLWQDGLKTDPVPYPSVEIPCEDLYSLDFDHPDEAWVELPFDLSALEGVGMVYPVVQAETDCAIVEGGYYTDLDPLRSPKIGIVICTYRRESYVEDNLARLNAFWATHPETKDHFDVFVVDNAKTLPPLTGATLIPNRNLGGSGGFTRGLMETYRRGYTHALLMDDDIAFDPNGRVKTCGLLSYAASPTLSVGGGMIRREEPAFQYEMGAVWTGTGLRGLRRGYDLTREADVLRNERDQHTDYNAWWYMCMPLSFVRDYGLPLPLFIKGDDVEYGLRCTKGEIALLNGVGVWHDNFDFKYSGELPYYVKRNELIVNALRSPSHSALSAAKKLVRGLAKELIFQHYATARLIFAAYDDFLKGPDYLLHLDGEALHQALRKDQQQYSKEQLVSQGYDLDRPYYQGKKRSFVRLALTLDGYLFPSCAFDKKEKQKGRLLHLATATPRDFYKAPWTIQYNHETDRGFVTRLSRKTLWSMGWKLLPLFFKTLRRYRKVCRLYWDKQDELTSWDTWERLLQSPKASQ